MRCISIYSPNLVFPNPKDRLRVRVANRKPEIAAFEQRLETVVGL